MSKYRELALTIAVALFALGFLAVSTSVGQEVVYPNTVGLYFDTSTGLNCMPTVATYPVVTTIYIIAHFVECSSGIGAWEMRLAPSGNLYLSLNSISGDYLNIGVFPNIIVGLATPLESTDNLVLASVTLFATGPGSVSIWPSEPSSYPDDSVSAFVCYGSTEINALFPLYGGSGAPTLSIGTQECPDENPFGGGGIVRTDVKTWSVVKSLYQ